MSEHRNLTETEADAALRALFAEGSRPSMSDPDFTGAVMARVQADASRRLARLRMAIPVVAGLGIGALWLNLPVVGEWIGKSADVLAPQMANLGAGGTTLLLAALAAGAGYLYAERA
jgi:hypothetical protein